MRSPDSSARLPAVALALTAWVFAAAACWTVVDRSTIPSMVDATVTAVEVRPEKHPGVDDVWMVTFEGSSPMHIDAAVAARMSVGARVEKGRWEASMTVDGQPHDLRLSQEAHRMLLLAPLLALVLTGLALVRHPGRIAGLRF
jgi:hypothetical protein